MNRHNARQFTIRERLFGPVLYVRHAVPVGCPVIDFEWSKWRPARPGEIKMAIIKLTELDIAAQEQQ
jgi:hypothetical protein